MFDEYFLQLFNRDSLATVNIYLIKRIFALTKWNRYIQHFQETPKILKCEFRWFTIPFAHKKFLNTEVLRSNDELNLIQYYLKFVLKRLVHFHVVGKIVLENRMLE